MKKLKFASILLFIILCISICINIRQDKVIEGTQQSVLANTTRALGTNINTAYTCIQSRQSDGGFQFGRGFEALMNASERAHYLSTSSLTGKNKDSWRWMYSSLEQSANIVGQINIKSGLAEKDISQLADIVRLLDIYVDVMQKVNPNTGYLDEVSIQRIEKAANAFYETLE